MCYTNNIKENHIFILIDIIINLSKCIKGNKL